jgi:hypothetical protein
VERKKIKNSDRIMTFPFRKKQPQNLHVKMKRPTYDLDDVIREVKEKVFAVFIIIHYCWLPFSYMRLTDCLKQKMHQHVVNAVDAVTFHFRFLSFIGTFHAWSNKFKFSVFSSTSNDSSLIFLWQYKFIIVPSLKVTKRRKTQLTRGKICKELKKKIITNILTKQYA